VWNKELTNVACLCFVEPTDRMPLDDTDRVPVPLLVPNPEENRLVMAVIQKYTAQVITECHITKDMTFHQYMSFTHT
jgi:hypothetical protein